MDCGEGTQMQLARHNCNLHRINHIFISHLHGDHFLGLLPLLFTMHLNHRTNDLHLYSHRGLAEILLVQLKYSNSALRFKVIFHELSPRKREVILSTKHFTVETLPLFHKLVCSGFLFREKPKPRRIDKSKIPDDISLQQLASLKTGADVKDEYGNIVYKNIDLTCSPRKSRSYAYCSDTAYQQSLIEMVKNVDVLYHESTFMEEEKDKAIETKHSTASEAGRIARFAKPGKLLIGHFSARYKILDPLLAEAKAEFPNTMLAIEGETFVIEE